MRKFDKPFIIGETAFHHQGDKDFLLKLVDTAAALKLDAIKFHLLLDLKDYMVSDHQAIDTLAGICLAESDWDDVYTYTSKLGLKIIFLCNDVKSVQWVRGLTSESVFGVEIHATGINDIFLLEEASKYTGIVLLGTGGSTLEEINFAVSFLRDRKKDDLLLMHGFQNYPTNYSDVVLSKMQSLSSLFDLPVGYADHTDPSDVNNEIISTLGIAMGFNVIEKHFTIVPGEKRIDSQSAVSVDQMTRIKQLSEVLWKARGADSLMMSQGEIKYGDIGPMKKAIVARKKVAKGEVLELGNLAYKRTNRSSYIKQHHIQSFIGQKALKDIEEDEIIDYNNVEFSFKIGDFSQFNNVKK